MISVSRTIDIFTALYERNPANPVKIKLPRGLWLSLNAWDGERYWAILGTAPINLTCDCGQEFQIGGAVFLKAPLSRRLM